MTSSAFIKQTSSGMRRTPAVAAHVERLPFGGETGNPKDRNGSDTGIHGRPRRMSGSQPRTSTPRRAAQGRVHPLTNDCSRAARLQQLLCGAELGRASGKCQP